MPSQLHINSDFIREAFQKHVRDKALQAGSKIVYRSGSQLIEEDPRTSQKKVIKEYSPS